MSYKNAAKSPDFLCRIRGCTDTLEQWGWEDPVTHCVYCGRVTKHAKPRARNYVKPTLPRPFWQAVAEVVDHMCTSSFCKGVARVWARTHRLIFVNG